ncbi:MAG: hypothetical protein FJ291_21825 [Planctomycetes bacterium]|nr:hypothetical protein [Planctomycetota bacterium]
MGSISASGGKRPIAAVGLLLLACSALAAPPAPVPFLTLPEKEGCLDLYLWKQVELPAGKVVRAWTAASATHEFVLYVNGREACRSRYGRVASAFRLAEEIEDLAPFFKPGTNTLAAKAHRWSPGAAQFYLKAEVQVETPDGIVPVAIESDASWLASYDAPAKWNTAGFKPVGWQAPKTQSAHRPGPRIRRDMEAVIRPPVPPPLPKAAIDAFPQIAEQSDWAQQVVTRDPKADAERLMRLFQTRFIADRYAEAIERGNTHMGDSFSINGYPVGNGWVFTALGPWPFVNTTGIVGPEYQYPVQWNPGTTFCGDQVSVTAEGKPLPLNDQWMWKIRKTDVVVAAASDPGRKAVFYALTLAPPGLKALIRIYAVANTSDAPLKTVVITNTNHRTKVAGKTLTETVKHGAMTDAAGDANTRTIQTGVLDDLPVEAVRDEKANNGSLKIALGDIAPGEARRCLLYHVTCLETVNDKPVASDAEATLAKVKERGYGLLDDTVKHWRDYNAATTTLEAPGPWGTRVADFIDDVKMSVQVQQFERTGAVGPMWFFSDQWIRDACGPVKSFLRTGRFDNAKRVLDYHYLASVACRKILNWLPMDVDIAKPWPPVDDWSQITMSYADRHANCEVPSWIILKHHWYFRFTGDTRTIADHWGYLKRCFYGQFDNPADKLSRPDFRIPFHGDETYIYSGGEALWGNRYDLQQNSYPGGNITSADSSFELAAAGDALVEMAKAIGKNDEAAQIAEVAAKIREATEKYYWMPDLGMYAQGESVLFPGQLNRYPMANIQANVLWSGYAKPSDPKAVSNALRMTEYLAEDSGVFNPITGYDVTVGMLQGQCLHTLAAINHSWAEKAFHALLMIAGDTTEFSEWMAPGPDFRTMYRANRIRPWEAGINLDAALYYLTGFEPDAPNKRLTLTPRLPSGIYSPIKWDEMTIRNLPMGQGTFDLTVDEEGYDTRTRTYRLASHNKDDVAYTLNILIPFARIDRVMLGGGGGTFQSRGPEGAAHVADRVPFRSTKVFSQTLAMVTGTLAAGRCLKISVCYRPLPVKPVEVALKPFDPPKPSFEKSDIVVFSALRPQKEKKLLRDLLAEKLKVLCLDATLPTDPATFEAALLTRFGRRTDMLILDDGSMAGPRKDTFWQDPDFDTIIGKFLSRGGVVLEASSRNASSKWLAKTLAPATFSVDYARGADILAMDAPDEKLDKQFYWLDEKQAEACGKWSGYWAGTYTMRYLTLAPGAKEPSSVPELDEAGPKKLPLVATGALITDRPLIWGTQEQPHGCMQYTMNATPGKDHLIRIRTWPMPKKGFTLQVTEDDGKTWKPIQTLWVPQPIDPKQNGWIDVFLTLPGKHVTKSPTVFRIGQPEGSGGGIGYAGYHSTGAARIWIRDTLEKPPSMAEMNTASTVAAKLALPDKGIVSYSSGRIAADGFTAPYRILGDSRKAALILKPVGRGLYVKTELTALFPVEKMAAFVAKLLDPAARRVALR